MVLTLRRVMALSVIGPESTSYLYERAKSRPHTSILAHIVKFVNGFGIFLWIWREFSLKPTFYETL